jgi:cobalt-zinc-cadmium efflux system membrane fusion protein
VKELIMETKQRNLLLGAAGAAIVVAVGGAFVGHTLWAPKQNHTGETVEAHLAELKGLERAAKPETAAPIKAEHKADKVEMSTASVAAAGIVLETTVGGNLTGEVAAQGTVAAAPDGEAILTARAAGAITQIRKRIGDPVARGEVIAVVASSEAAGISAALASAKAKLELARSTFEREKRLFDAKITARQELEAAQSELGQAEAEYRRSDAAARAARVSADGASVSIASPISGRITSVTDSAKLGAYVAPETTLFRIADPKRIQIEAAVPVTDARRISPGDTATVVSVSGETLQASVRAVTPGVSAESRSATVVLALTHGIDGLQLGQFVRVQVKLRSNAETVGRYVLPEEAVQTVEGRAVVFVREGEAFVATPVQVGARSGGRIEVISGLSDDQKVASKNAFLLKAELGKSAAED